MEDRQKYLQDKLKEFNRSYNALGHLNSYSDKQIKRQWKEESSRTQRQWQSIQSISDVTRYVNGFTGTVAQYKNIRGLFSDAYEMDLALYRAVNAIQKMAQCYDIDDFDFCNFSIDNIDKMFNTLYKGVEEMQKVNMHRAMQD
ncbi:MAG: hypothetical protein PHD56_06485 [Anaerostipes sp.]|nr:hypothetical protein [Anaerostipes sp.]